MNWGAAFTGLGQGFPQGLKDAQGIEGQYEAGLYQAGQIALGRALQGLGSHPQGPPLGMPQQMGGGPPPMPQGGPPMGAPQQGGSGMAMGMPPPGGAPNAFAGRFPTASPMGQPIGAEPDMQASDPSRAGGYAALYAAMPQGQLPRQSQPAQYPGMGQQQPQGQPQGQQGGMPDINQIVQQIAQANPGAPPQVIASAVMQYVKSISPMLYRDAMLGYRGIGVRQRQEVLDQGQQKIEQAGRLGAGRLQQGEERLDITREMYGQALKGGGQQSAADFDKAGGMGGQQSAKPQGAADRIAEQMVSGKAPPLTTGMYRLSGPVRAALAKDHPEFNLAQAQLEWKKAERMTSGLTSPQQVRFQQLGVSVVNTMDMAMEQAKKLQLSGITPLNKAKLDALINLRGNSPIGQEAAKYVQTVAFLKGEVANLENGGYAPTESSWAQARNVINENYGVEEFLATMPNAQRLINYRLQAQQKVPEGMSQGTRYKVPQGPEEPAQQGAPKGQKIDRAAAKKAGYSDQEIDAFEAGK